MARIDVNSDSSILIVSHSVRNVPCPGHHHAYLALCHHHHAVRRPYLLRRTCYSGFFRCYTVRAAAWQMLTDTERIYLYHHHHAVRRPCRLMLHGLLRVFQVLRIQGTPSCRSRGRARTSRTRPPAALRFAPQRRRTGPLQALSNAACRQAFIARPPPHPSHSFACEGPSARKTLRRPRHLRLWPGNVNEDSV
ncbi:MAG: hypothetical protein A4E28_01938 [Methanocella sp. PtaU1.Bin125]|nr:MAG: hypothetical protein A4E28_01938 [Methanocella sp. PtaU1.Bin125]